MGWDGGGAYNRVHNFSADASAGIKILASRMDAEINDIASAIPIAWARDGQNVPTVDLPMGGKKFVNVGAPTSVGNFMRVREFIENVPVFMQDVQTSADRISVSSQYFTSVSSNQAPVDGTKIIVRVLSDKSSAVLYLDGHSANVINDDGDRIEGGALTSGGIYELIYSSTETAWRGGRPKPFYGRTAAEISAGITPTNYQIPSHTATGTVIVDRYGTNTTPGTTSMQTALDSAKLVSQQSGCPIELLGETYLGTLSLRFDNAGVIGQGSRYTTLKNPAGALSTGGVIEVGDTASGNGAAAYVGFICRGLTIDGNKAAATAPADDVTGHGLILTNTTHWRITDVIAKNCHNAGVIPVIVSSYGHVECTVESCGNATHTGPGFDINSSSHITGSVISKDCYQGARVLDNCFGVNLKASVYNATNHGFIYNNQTVNFSYGNNLDVTVHTCGAIGVSIGLNCSSSNIRATVYDATSFGCQIGGNASFPSYGNNITLATYSGDVAGLYIDVGADDNIIDHTSVLDGRAGAQGSVFAVDVNGNRNKLTVALRDSATWQVRGIAVRAGATDNDILAYSFTNTADPYNDAGTRTRRNGWLSGTSSIASGTTSIAVTHGAPSTPAATDIIVNFTEQGTNDYGRVWISNITSTQFTVNVSTDPGASNLDFSWRIAV